jgi:TetR/AcrR family transcriptional repressor of bet genes
MHMALTAAELVGTHGLDALTFRNVARAAGSSTTVLTHYFADKHDLMLCTYQVMAERSGAHFDAARRAGGGLYECLEALLPLDKERQAEWRLFTCYWGMAISDPKLAKEQAKHVRSAQRRMETMLRERLPDTANGEIELLARRLGSLVHGLGAHHCLDPGFWSPAKQRRVLLHEINSLLVAAPQGEKTAVAGA